jgi:hypothetical protein
MRLISPVIRGRRFNSRSGHNFLDQHRIVVASAGLFDAQEYSPHAKAIFRGRPQNLPTSPAGMGLQIAGGGREFMTLWTSCPSVH